jgi:hypothetical protein
MSEPRIIRRLGATPAERDPSAEGARPNLFELSDGSFAFVGTDKTDELRDKLPAGASCATYERIVVVSRATLLGAKLDIPET